MRRRIALLLPLTILVVALAPPATGVAGEATPLSVAQGKRQAKAFLREVCRDRAATCTGVRVRDCSAVTKFRVDCAGFVLGRNSFCSLKVRVVATGDQTVRVDGFGIKCGQKYN